MTMSPFNLFTRRKPGFSCPRRIDGNRAKGYIPPQVLANRKRSRADSKRTFKAPDRIGYA